MIFIIEKFERLDETLWVDKSGYTWTLWKEDKGKPTEKVVRSVKTYPSEKDARADIASAKIALRGARFAKVRGAA